MELFGIVRKMHERKRQNPFKDITTKRTKKNGLLSLPEETECQRVYIMIDYSRRQPFNPSTPEADCHQTPCYLLSRGPFTSLKLFFCVGLLSPSYRKETKFSSYGLKASCQKGTFSYWKRDDTRQKQE